MVCDNVLEVFVVEECGVVGIQCCFFVDVVLCFFQVICVECLFVGDVGEWVVVCVCELVLYEV